MQHLLQSKIITYNIFQDSHSLFMLRNYNGTSGLTANERYVRRLQAREKTAADIVLHEAAKNILAAKVLVKKKKIPAIQELKTECAKLPPLPLHF